MVLSAYHTSFPRYLQVTARFGIKGLLPIRRDGQTRMIFGHPPPQTAQEIRSKDEVGIGPSIAQSTKSVQQLVSPPASRPSPLAESTTSSLNVTQRPTQQISPKDSNNMESRKSSARRIHRPSLKSNSSHLLTTNIFTGTGQCKQTPNCVFSNKIFILAPCISSHLWLTEDLLKPHGATYITSLVPVTRRVLPKRCPNTGRRVREIALAEHGRKEQTLAFMHQIRGLNLTRSNGKHDLIEVVDWRLLERIVNVELGNGGEIDAIFK
ncbi:6c9b9625-67b6-4f43-8f3d-f7d91447a443 [Sclerotinia trifoliorum]|uniref:6c9b9625-67b6-4f43-8f3d-f7d91447a443 n=1 Tax=Sclerotinia trifoliorum TaxID=28548 RepID=A0A8H2W2T7_9HELO|nr:6c9b9625-67b6-4f43-8f3d-f7d91447a443 [Sclerotinia trifoliorum]